MFNDEEAAVDNILYIEEEIQRERDLDNSIDIRRVITAQAHGSQTSAQNSQIISQDNEKFYEYENFNYTNCDSQKINVTGSKKVGIIEEMKKDDSKNLGDSKDK